MRSIALAGAAANDERQPAGLTARRTTRRRANRLAGGDGVDTDQPVYLVALRGSFAANDVPRPPGARPPSGRAMKR